MCVSISALTFDNLHVTRDEGIGTGSFTYDFVKHHVRLKDIKSNLRPTDAILWVDPKLFKEVTPYKFRQPPNVVANGVVHLRGRKGDRLEIKVDAPAGMDYVFLGKTLPLDRVSGRLLFTDGRSREARSTQSFSMARARAAAYRWRKDQVIALTSVDGAISRVPTSISNMNALAV